MSIIDSIHAREILDSRGNPTVEAEGIRDAQDIIATSLTGAAGQRYLYWRYLEVLGQVADGENNLVVAPTEGGIPIFFTPGQRTATSGQ